MNKFHEREIPATRARIWLSLFAAAAALIALAPAPAQAQATRTWVSGVGDDVNPCSRTAPCKTFAGAISKTAASGEINCLDPGGFGGVTITKSITIRCDHVEAGVLVSGTNGITINAAATDRVVLEGLDIEGLGTGIHGVSILAVGNVEIIRCAIRHFNGNGVNMTSSTANSRVVITDSIISYNIGGVNVLGSGAVANSALISKTLIDGNTSFGVKATNAVNVIAMVRTVIAGSPAGISAVTGGQVVSFGPSNVIGGTGAPTSTTLYQ